MAQVGDMSLAEVQAELARTETTHSQHMTVCKDKTRTLEKETTAASKDLETLNQSENTDKVRGILSLWAMQLPGESVDPPDEVSMATQHLAKLVYMKDVIELYEKRISNIITQGQLLKGEIKAIEKVCTENTFIDGVHTPMDVIVEARATYAAMINGTDEEKLVSVLANEEAVKKRMELAATNAK